MAFQLYCEREKPGIGYSHFYENVTSIDLRNDIIKALSFMPEVKLIKWRETYKYGFGKWHFVDLNEKGE